jgi:hypothetical protein
MTFYTRKTDGLYISLELWDGDIELMAAWLGGDVAKRDGVPVIVGMDGYVVFITEAPDRAYVRGQIGWLDVRVGDGIEVLRDGLKLYVAERLGHDYALVPEKESL